MSLVGPRPERPEFVAALRPRHHPLRRAPPRQAAASPAGPRCTASAGKTSLSDRIEWDNFYIEHWSWKLDLKILALTFIAVLRPAE